MRREFESTAALVALQQKASKTTEKNTGKKLILARQTRPGGYLLILITVASNHKNLIFSFTDTLVKTAVNVKRRKSKLRLIYRP